VEFDYEKPKVLPENQCRLTAGVAGPLQTRSVLSGLLLDRELGGRVGL
jgi:hypothetical protein